MRDRETPLLLTPGPLTTARSTKEAMLRDWGSRDEAFLDLNAGVLDHILDIAEARETHVCVPLQGSGTFAVEAMIGTMVPRDGKVLVPINGAYGRRIGDICKALEIEHTLLDGDEIRPLSADVIAATLQDDAKISHVAMVHCETTTGVLNPLQPIAEAVEKAGRALLVDAVSSFGAISVSARQIRYDALVASSNKCLEGVPGVAFAVITESALARSRGNARSLSLDLYDQWRAMKANRQWRFTPPTHVLAALDRALRAHRDEGGVTKRGERYRRNCDVLIEGMRSLGFRTAIEDQVQAPIIATFLTPSDPSFDFAAFYGHLAQRGFLIYPGKLTSIDTFRIGCIGDVQPEDMRRAVQAVATTVKEIGVASGAP